MLQPRPWSFRRASPAGTHPATRFAMRLALAFAAAAQSSAFATPPVPPTAAPAATGASTPVRTADGPDAAGAPARTAWPLLWAVPCHVYGCAPLFWSLDRRERERERQAAQRTEPAPAPPITDLWGSSGVWGYTRRIPPPTPDSEIRPEYRDSGRLRPEFAPAPAAQ